MATSNNAAEALRRAREQLERVSSAAWEPSDPFSAVTWAFYAYENAVVAVAESRGVRWQKNHPAKARLAGTFAQDGVLATNVEERLRELNELRKEVAYGEPSDRLREVDLEDLAVELEQFLEEVSSVIQPEQEE